jgi:flagellar basal body-associated protein FliL
MSGFAIVMIVAVVVILGGMFGIVMYMGKTK